MITCKRITPCDTVILDHGSHVLTAVSIFDAIVPDAYPHALPRLGLGMFFERDADDPHTLKFVVKLRFGDECFFTSNVFTLDFFDETHARYALNITIAGCLVPAPGSLSAEVWDAAPAGKMIDNVRILFGNAPTKTPTPKHDRTLQ